MYLLDGYICRLRGLPLSELSKFIYEVEGYTVVLLDAR